MIVSILIVVTLSITQELLNTITNNNELGDRNNTNSSVEQEFVVFLGGHNEPDPSSVFDIIDYITIATLGNAQDFGNLIAAEQEGNSFFKFYERISFWKILQTTK